MYNVDIFEEKGVSAGIREGTVYCISCMQGIQGCVEYININFIRIGKGKIWYYLINNIGIVL